MNISGYQITEIIYESLNSKVYQAVREEDQEVVMVKTLSDSYPGTQDVAKIRREHQIVAKLNGLEGIIEVYEFVPHGQGNLAIIMEPFGLSLAAFMGSGQRLSLSQFFKIALKITKALGLVHQENVVHKDINPRNILIDPSLGEIRLIDFGIASQLSKERQDVNAARQLVGSLPYISPEQTGRMNRDLDYRSDYYSLGVTFYELLTGQRPFISDDALALVHAHMAQQPTPPHEIAPALPLALSNIIMKLLAKRAKERYQSAWGIKADLERCLEQLERTGTISPFPLATEDISDTFQIPQKLYGRSEQLETLLAAFERVTMPAGAIEMLLVSGYAGVGKSALVNELYKPITAKRGYFVSGKFDQFQRNIPYSGLTQALDALMKQLLSEDEAELARWRDKIEAAVGKNGQVLIDLIPSLELVIGKQPPVAEVGGQERLNRFNLLFQTFIRAISQADHPLVLFIDDMQWADVASLNLLKRLMSDQENRHLLLIAAYRDNEVDATHPLMLTLEGMKEEQARLSFIQVPNLTGSDVNRLIADTLSCPPAYTQPLADLVYAKTEGNPFFTIEFLKSLYEEGLLHFEPTQRQWEWEISQIQAKNITDNVVALMAGKISDFVPETQAVLQIGACIGNRFDWHTLALVAAERLSLTNNRDLSNALWLALEEGLIMGLAGQSPLAASLFEVPSLPISPLFKFQHDRVQQAAYSLLAKTERQAIHLAIGRLLLADKQAEEVEEALFTIVNQLNHGREWLTPSDQADVRQLVEFNLRAGKKAKLSAAYQPAWAYFQVALELLGSSAWSDAYQLSLRLHQESAEVAYLSGEFEEAGKLIEVTLDHASSVLDKVKVIETQILFYGAQFQLQAAVDSGLQLLPELGLSLSQFPPQGLVIDQLYELPEMSAPDKLAAMRILMRIAPPAFMINPMLYSQIIFSMVDLCVQHGNSLFAPFPYVSYGVILCGFMGNIELGYQIGQVALRVLDKFEARELKCKVDTLFNVFIRSWKEHASQSIAPLQEALQIGLETGDLEFTAYAALNLGMKRLLVGEPLESLLEEQTRYINLLEKIKQEYQLLYASIWKQFALNLTLDLTPNITNQSQHGEHGAQLLGSAFNEQQMRPILEQTHNLTSLFALHLAKTMLNYLLKSYGAAVENAMLAEPYAQAGMGLLEFAHYNFYTSLALLAHYPEVEASQQAEYLKKVISNQEQLKNWASHAPMNFQHKHDLVAAEEARILGHHWHASQLYERAIAGAKRHAYLAEEALAYELAAEFYLAQGMNEIAQRYISKAHYGYVRWQASAKVKQLQARYPQWLLKSESRAAATQTITRFITSTTAYNELDLASLMKASQAISSEIMLDRLLAKMMRIVIENAGAERGLFLSSKNGEWQIAAQATAQKEKVDLTAIPLDLDLDLEFQLANEHKRARLDSHMVNYVIRTQESLVLDHATQQGGFTSTPYVSQNQPKSILCMPLINQTELVGLIYLENNLTTHAFTPQRVEIMRLLGTQAAISISHAQAIQLRAQQTQLRLEKELAQKANQAKSDFLSSMSHELRTPLNGILGYAQLLKRDQALDPRQKSSVEIIHQSGHHLLTLINDILDLSKIEARKMDLYPQELHLSSFLNTVEGIIRMRAEEKDVLFVYQPDDTLPTSIKADEKRLRQVLINLLGNAVKFTKRGQVTLKVSHQNDTQNDHITLRFEIIDTGVGMTPQQLEKIFLPFEQVGEVKQRAKGTGLGLAITRQLVNLMGGEVFVSSELGKGSRFWFDLTLPVVVSKKNAEEEDDGAEARIKGRIKGYQGLKRTILVVDDQAESRQLLSSMLSPLGFEIVQAENGQQEVELSRQLKPDLILTDLMMPVMNGFEAVKLIRHFAPHLPIIAISANAFEAAQKKSRLAGCNAFLPKPIEEQPLLALIGQHLELEWTYERIEDNNNEAQEKMTENKPFNAPQLIAPPAEELEQLYELASLGRMSALRKRLTHIEQLDQKYAPFASQVRQLARAFEDEKIVALIEEQLEINGDQLA